jgi:hypothetical protein
MLAMSENDAIQYAVTDAELAKLADSMLGGLAALLAALAAGCVDKEPDQLSDQEKVALAIYGGCNYEFTQTGIRVTESFAIQKVRGKLTIVRWANRAATSEARDE